MTHRSNSPEGSDPAPLVIAVAQCRSVIGDIEENLAVVAALCAEAREHDADLVLFPECQASGYSYTDVAGLVHRTAQPVNGPIGSHLLKEAAKNSLVVCCGMLEKDGCHFYNTQVIAFPDGRLQKQRKGVPSSVEKGVLNFEDRRLAFEWKGVRFGILVCADSAMADWENQFQKLGISLLLHPSAGPINRDEQGQPEGYLRKSRQGLQCARLLAQKNNIAYAVANPIGFSGEDLYPGNSWIVDSRGDVLAWQPPVTNMEKMTSSLGVASIRFSSREPSPRTEERPTLRAGALHTIGNVGDPQIQIS